MYSTKEELAEYLKHNDHETLEWLQAMAKEFGPAETFAYIKTKKQIKPLPVRETAAKMSDDLVQSKLEMIVSEYNKLTKEAKSRYGEKANIFLRPDGHIAILSSHLDIPYRTVDNLSRFTSKTRIES